MLIFIQVFQQFQLSNIYRNLFHHMLGIYGGELNIHQRRSRGSSSQLPIVWVQKGKLPGDDQFLLMWMKLRLNTPMRDLATRFGISETTCSTIFSSWGRASANVLKSFVFSPDQGTINATKPPRFSPV